MSDPSTYRPAPGDIPEDPGVYRFYDPHGRVIYVGKAKNLRSRLNSYFADPAGLHPRTYAMVTSAAGVTWTVVQTEVDALQLEFTWIKEFDPRFNVKYRDDKSYPYLAITMGETYPRVQVMRGAKRKGTKYFGPYSHAWAIRETVDQLLRVFPVRTCSNGVFRRAEQIGRPCLLGYIDKCSAPCVGRVSEQEHRALAVDFADFLSGQTSRFIKQREAQMRTAAEELDFERAARLRDDVAALRKVVERNAVVLSDGTDADVFGTAEDELEVAVQVFHVRAGRVRGQRGWVAEKVEELSSAELIEHLLQQTYADVDPAAIPRDVLVPVLPVDVSLVQQWLTERRGGPVQVRVAQRGAKKALADTVTTNAQQAFALHQMRRGADLSTRSQALNDLTEALDLANAPLRIECYDVSHVAGTHQVASMVVFEDGLARKDEYRRFTLRQQGSDDVAAMSEVLTRRLRRLLDEQVDQGAVAPGADEVADDGAGRSRKFAYPPQLIVVDGGAPQVSAAARVLVELGIDDIAVCGLAKRLEEVWLPDQEYPVILPRSSPALYLLQRLRDEAHRFAIAHHRSKRSKAMVASELDGIVGLGPARRQALVTAFGSVAAIRVATVDELTAVEGIGPALAQVILDSLPASQ